MKFVFLVLVILSICKACENGCSGHGECGNGDKCDCFPGWGGSDCNERSCPYSDAFVDLLPGDLDHNGVVDPTDGSAYGDPIKLYHYVKSEWNPKLGTPEAIGKLIVDTKRAHRYAECSNAGICNRVTGLCNCNSGFEGSACQRRSCPSSSEGLVCNGHGICMSSEASIIHGGNANLPSGWEYEKFGVCVCDKGWTGISCGSRICPKGIDPVTKGSYLYSFTISGSTDLLPSSDPYGIASHYYEMVYDGVKYTTPIIPAITGICDSNGKLVSSKSSEAAEDIRRAIVSIPPLSQSKVSFTCGSGQVVASIIISTPYIELDLKAGSQTCNKPNDGFYSCTVDIGSPTNPAAPLQTTNKPSSFTVHKGDGSEITSTTIALTMTATSKSVDLKDAAGTATVTPIEDGDGVIPCSGRGLCDSTSGLCECFDGFSGVACEKQRSS